MRTTSRSGCWSVVLLAGLLAVAGLPAAAQNIEGMKGRLLDADGKPLALHRAIFRPVEGDETYVSGPSDADGNYVISLPLGGQFVPVALVTPNGGRIELPPDEPPLMVRKGGGRTIQLPVGVTSEAADSRDVLVAGKITDSQGDPLAGYRLVFRLENQIFLSNPSLANGEYTATLPERQLLTPLAACSSNGLRFELDEPPLQPRTNTRRDFQLPTRSSLMNEPAFAGADRLFLSFAEDAATTDFVHEQSQLDMARINSQDVLISRVILAAQLPGAANTEIGLNIGYGSYERGILSDVSGMTDLDVWAKLNLGPAKDGTEYAVGFLVTVPTGEEAPVLGYDAWATKLFVSGRRVAGGGMLSANAGLRITGDGRSLGMPLSGRFSGSAAAGFVTAVHPNVGWAIEGAVETERFGDVDPEFRLLTGFNVHVKDMMLRLAVAGGLTDSTPDYQVLAGLAIEF